MLLRAHASTGVIAIWCSKLPIYTILQLYSLQQRNNQLWTQNRADLSLSCG